MGNWFSSSQDEAPPSSQVSNEHRPNGVPSNGVPTNGVPVNGVPSNGVPANGVSASSSPQQQAVHAESRTEAVKVVPARPNKLGDPLQVTDDARQAAAQQRAADAAGKQNTEALKRESAERREGKYSIYGNPVARQRMPTVAPLDDCLRQYQHHYREAQHALRCQRQMTLPCNQCYGGYSGQNNNNVRAARTNLALLNREQRTIAANLDARHRMTYVGARPTQLGHREETTRTSKAATSIESLTAETAEEAYEPAPAVMAAQEGNNVDSDQAPASVSIGGGVPPSRSLALKCLHMHAQSHDESTLGLGPAIY